MSLYNTKLINDHFAKLWVGSFYREDKENYLDEISQMYSGKFVRTLQPSEGSNVKGEWLLYEFPNRERRDLFAIYIERNNP